MIKPTPNGRPRIASSAFISESADILGDVAVEDDVFVAPHATIRADEPGSKVVIRSGSNVQDNCVVHALAGTTVEIGCRSTLAHGCIVHGPCMIGEGCFLGFGTIVFQSTLGEGCFILHRAVVQKVDVPPGSFIDLGQIVDSQETVRTLEGVPERYAAFAAKVVEANLLLAKEYGRKER
ncbi:MAG: hypothetical protein MUE65_04395 [Methanomassiliicoccales archaeon]|jgi:carbonic anhydrase/acetyltransferase-like protein (isoleucine patch superfamily)|nr:hypothetical protein [Methanomassiliicoccales archaeon]